MAVSKRIHKKCPHGRQKGRCYECGGSQICPHMRRKSRCKYCGGGEICTHGKHKIYCKDCQGSQICLHGKQKYRCKDCGGSGFCPHGKHKFYCKDCSGTGICPHGRNKFACKECGGSHICQHGRPKSQCAECNNFVCEFCNGQNFGRAARLLKHMQSFPSDNPKARTKKKELEVYQALQDAGIQFEYQVHIPFRACGLESETKCAYPDFLFYKPWGVLILEVDEEQHASYPPACDVRRELGIAASIASGSPQEHASLR